MGSELVTGSPPLWIDENGTVSTRHMSHTDFFYSCFPFYLSIGMTYDQYWNDDCLLVRHYRKAQQLKQQRRNQELWVQGAYIYEAIKDISPILNAFAKKGTNPLPYISEPFPLTREEVRDRKEREEKIRYDEHKANIAAWITKTNTRIAGQEVNRDE